MPKTATPVRENLIVEARTIKDEGTGVFLIDIISPGWGSSGFYSAEALQQAATDNIFAAGTHMYIDHPTAQEDADRPERSLHGLAAVLLENAVWTGESLQAKARVFSPWRNQLAEMKDTIGVSIRATADVELGEAEGRHGRLVKRLVEAVSVDFVTHAGRGGKIVDVLESATVAEARNVGQWIESRIHRDFTITADDMAGDGRLTRDERIGLSGAIGAALNAFVQHLETTQPQLYTRDLWDEPTDTIAAAIETTQNLPDHPAGQHKTEESKEDTMAVTQIEESELATLRADASRVTALETERDEAVAAHNTTKEKLAEADKAVRESKIARVIAEADVEFSDLEKQGLQAVAATHVDEAGVFDEDAFTKAVTEAAAAKAETAGVGKVRGFGQRTETSESKVTLADLDESIDATFGGPITKEA